MLLSIPARVRSVQKKKQRRCTPGVSSFGVRIKKKKAGKSMTLETNQSVFFCFS